MAKGLFGGGLVWAGFTVWAKEFRGVGCPNVVGGLPKAGTGLLAKAPTTGFAKGFWRRLLGWPNGDWIDGWPKADCWPPGAGAAGLFSGRTAPLASQMSMRLGCCFSPLMMYLTAPSRSLIAVCICWLASATSPCASRIACCCLPAAASS